VRQTRRALNKNTREVEEGAGEHLFYHPVTMTVSGGATGGWERARNFLFPIV
jgi:hypothetical protein